MNVLQVGTIEPSLADILAAKYQALQLPNDATRADFLAEHGRSPPSSTLAPLVWMRS